jgi:spore coat polysaccharide biosynthesis protein SpsF
LGSIRAPDELNHPDWRWTLDTIEDFNFIRQIYERLYYEKPDFDAYDILRLLTEHSELLEINRRIQQRPVR